MSLFKEKVIKAISLVPVGTVVSYGQVALMVGIPRAARQVGGILNKYEGPVELPWWRVINNTGRITIKGSAFTPTDQKELLEAEGIEVGDDFTLDIEKYRFRPDSKFLEEVRLPDDYGMTLMREFGI